MDKTQRFGVSVLTQDMIVFPFNSEPYYAVKSGSYMRHEKVDPFPAYRHDMYLVNDMMKHVTKALPIDSVMDTHITLLSHEVLSRVNGYAWATERCETDVEAGKKQFRGQILLAAKRTPIHPAMTRYMVSHEYGHLVQRAIEITNGLHEYQFEEEYAALRNIAHTPANYGGGTWHLAAGELFANDFRLLVARAEMEFWPHPEIARPETLPDVLRFWNAMARSLDLKAWRQEEEARREAEAPSTQLALAV